MREKLQIFQGLWNLKDHLLWHLQEVRDVLDACEGFPSTESSRVDSVEILTVGNGEMALGSLVYSGGAPVGSEMKHKLLDYGSHFLIFLSLDK